MNEYEITYLANPELDEAAKDKLDEVIDQIISEAKGAISQTSPATDSPGSRRRLHYPIVDKRVVWLRTIQAEIDPAAIQKLRGSIDKTDGVMRLSILQTKLRPEVTTAIFDNLKAEAEADKPAAAPTTEEEKPADHKPVSMKEVEDKIEKALDEEVK